MSKISIKKTGFVLLAILILIQFVNTNNNNGEAYGPDDITQSVFVSDGVKAVLEKSCFDCHSNHTGYPWYARIQPLGFWIQHHVNEGKEELNFSEFKAYRYKRKLRKMKEMEEQLNEKEMPQDMQDVISKWKGYHKNVLSKEES